jgi:hypothetical protein
MGLGEVWARGTLWLPYFLDSRLRDVSLTRLPPFTPGGFLVHISGTERGDPGTTVQLESLGQLKKKTLNLSGIEPATCRIVTAPNPTVLTHTSNNVG